MSWMAMFFTGKTDQQGKVVLYGREQLEFIEYCPGVDEEQVESSWVRRGRLAWLIMLWFITGHWIRTRKLASPSIGS